jgi:serine O-acetyltransferase
MNPDQHVSRHDLPRPKRTGLRTLWRAIRADLVAHDRFAIGAGWVPANGASGSYAPGAMWHRYRRNHHAAGIMMLYRTREWSLGRDGRILPAVCDRLMEIVHHTSLSREVKLGVGVYFSHGDAHIHGDTTIGDCAIIGVHTGIGLRGSFFSDDMGTNGPTIGAYTRVGTGAKVLGNISVGQRAVIGAGAVVLTDVPEAATVVGVPARIVRRGPVGPELVSALERLQALRRLADEKSEKLARATAR